MVQFEPCAIFIHIFTMKHFVLLLVWLPILLFGQKEDYIWHINHTCGLNEVTQIDFNSLPIDVSVVEKEMCVLITNSSICDSSGQILFYTNGLSIYNKYNEIIENGDSINFGAWSVSAGIYGYNTPQGAFFIKHPDDDNKYYLFHMFNDWIPGGATMVKFYYSLIDANDNDGHGRVLQKNVPLMTGNQFLTFNPATAARHANGRDWWIILPNHMGPQYFSFLLTPSGVNGPWTQEIGFKEFTQNYLDYGIGQRVFSLKGDKFVDYDVDNYTQVFDFDRCTGLLSNAQILNHGIDPNLNNAVGSVAFSPSGRFLYLSRTNDGYSLYQYDLYADDVLTSEIEIFHCPLINQQWECGITNMLLAPDGKIYVGGNDSISFSVIHKPDSLGLLCDYEPSGLNLPLAYPAAWFPYWPNYRLGALEGSECDTIVSSVEIALLDKVFFKLFPNPASGECTVEFEVGKGKSGVLVMFNALGSEMLRQTISESKGRLTLPDVPSGYYIVSLIFDDGTILSKPFICK